MLSRPESRVQMAETIGSKLNISREQVFEAPGDVRSFDDLLDPHPKLCVCVQAQHFCQMYLPGITRSESEVSVGRVSLGRKQAESVHLNV